jgi:glycerol-3-phosphate O-acyltransferase / dihydroxyacetone phosphate acyltransferase
MRRVIARLVYRALQAWARIAAPIVYRRVDVTEAARADRAGPTILAANHGNALADIAAIVAKVRHFPHFLAAATWWKSRPARILFTLGGVVPVYRRRDGEAAQNVSTFDACYRALSDGDQLAIFPEGEMHRETALLPLRTGTARIALGAAAEANVRDIAIVPVGLVYEDRGRFRSDAEVHVGEPIEIDEWIDRYRVDPARTVHAVTELLAERLAAVTVNHRSAAEARLVERAATIALADAPPVAQPFARHNELRRVLASALADAGGEESTEYRELYARVVAHDTDLASLGTDLARPLARLTDADRRRLDHELVLLAPPAALGLVVNAPTLLGAYAASKRVRDDMWQATTKGVAGTVLSPVVWITEFALLARRFGWVRAALVVKAGALAGIAALAWHDRWTDRRGVVWLARAAREQPAAIVAARASRDEVCRCVDTLTGPRRTSDAPARSAELP